MHIILCPDSMEELMQVLPVLNYLPSEDSQTTILISEDFDKPLAGVVCLSGIVPCHPQQDGLLTEGM